MSQKEEREEKEAQQREAGDLGSTHDLIHSFVMTVSYFTQGLVMGGNSMCVTLLQQYRDVSMAEQSLLSMSSYAYSLKFLWSPIVDSVFFGSKRYRRIQWIILCQIIACLAAFQMQFQWERLREDTSLLALVLFLMSASIATQDIAVDAFAMEGISSKSTTMAASAQTIGLLLGFYGVRVFPILQDYGWVDKDRGAAPLFSTICILEVLICLVILIYLTTKTCSRALDEATRREYVALKEREEELLKKQIEMEIAQEEEEEEQQDSKNSNKKKKTKKKNGKTKEQRLQEAKERSVSRSQGNLHLVGQDSTIESILGVFRDMKEVVVQPFFLDAVAIMLLRGISWGGLALMKTAELKRYGCTASFSATVSLTLLPLQLFISSIAGKIVSALKKNYTRKGTVIEVWFLVNTLQICFDGFTFFTFSRAAEDSDAYRYFQVIPGTITNSILGTITFNAIVAFSSDDIAAMVPHSTGTTITLCNSLMNFGMASYSSAGLWIVSQVAPYFAEKFYTAEQLKTDKENKLGENMAALLTVLWGFFIVGFIVRFLVIWPATQRVADWLVKKKETDEEKRDNNKLKQE